MRAVLVPVKDLRNAKQRLASVLTPLERLELAEAMLRDTVRALRGATLAQGIFVVTSYPPAAELARRLGWSLVPESQQVSESVSVDAASAICEREGVTALLRLPLDLPLVQSADVDELLAGETALPATLIVPSRDGTGTNALLRRPPTLFASQFGPGSFARHCAAAWAAGGAPEIRRNPRLEMDVDDESDLRALLEHDLSATETGLWLREKGVASRISTGLARATRSSRTS